MFVFLLAGCIETGLGQAPIPPVATPPPLPTDGLGNPPNWNDCFQGFVGEYTNHTAAHPDFEPPPPEPGVEVVEPDPADLDWWDDPSFQEFSANLDFGANWWPVDEGLEGDPAHFAVKWTSWIRAWSDTTMTFTLGSADDVWIYVGDDLVFSHYGVRRFEPETYSVSLDAGQYPFEVRYAHRSGESGMRFRVLNGDVSLCYARYEDVGAQ
ncbi:MAG: hypothetical protein H6736_04440 [Alphaproteobacteria bacterium]|nr:hypothetical protein [Alphaproteobacteria bacterium]MCB9691044.1 hypothetical protein [Alphaproteobacteria bacterium]